MSEDVPPVDVGTLVERTRVPHVEAPARVNRSPAPEVVVVTVLLAGPREGAGVAWRYLATVRSLTPDVAADAVRVQYDTGAALTDLELHLPAGTLEHAEYRIQLRLDFHAITNPGYLGIRRSIRYGDDPFGPQG